jgi:hypothetical protein
VTDTGDRVPRESTIAEGRRLGYRGASSVRD